MAIFVLAVLAALGLTVGALLVLRALPEPVGDDPDLACKISYRELVDHRFSVTCLALTIAAMLPLWWLPKPHWPLWVVYGSAVLVLVACDARTTWLPLRLTRLCFALAALAVVFGPWLNALLGALAGCTFFWVVWRLSKAFGFGDVRLAGLVGAVSGAAGANMWWTAILLGTLAAAVNGLLVSLWRRNHPSPLGKAFAYGPGLWLGPYLALGWVNF